MKRYRKTYGINGLLEWHGTIESNGVKMKIHFTNGSVTAYGVAPATYTTSDTLTQYIIENSDKFKAGRIVITMCVELPGTDTKEESKEDPVEAKTIVEVESLAEAKDYLVENHGIAASKLRSRAAILEQAEACGVEFKGI